MVPGSPAPLLPATSLRSLLELVPAGGAAGAWVRGARMPVRVRSSGRTLLLGPDLGTLLRRCDRVVVRQGGVPVVRSTADLIRCRVLEVVLGTPYLPPPALLRELYPGLRSSRGIVTLPLGLDSPEEALAALAAARLPVRATRVGYAPASG